MNKISKRIFNDPPCFGHCDFFSKDQKDLISYQSFPQEFFPIMSLFAADCNFNLKECYILHNRLFIKGKNWNGEENELMLRFGGRKLIVARICFVHQRKGNMTELYRILKRVQKMYSLESIVIECCITQASINWCTKQGFIPIGRSGSYIEAK